MPVDSYTAEHAGSPQPSDAGRSSRPKSRRYGFACVPCKQRKVKCSGEEPVCAGCQRKGSECVWPANARAGTESQLLREANERIRQLEGSLERHGDGADRTQTGTGTGSPHRPHPRPHPHPRASIDAVPAPDNVAASSPGTAARHEQLRNASHPHPGLSDPDGRAKRRRTSHHRPTAESSAGSSGPEPGASPHSAHSSHPTSQGQKSHDPRLAPSLWYQVGIGEDGGVVYNGPTSRFHAGTLPDPMDQHGEEDGSDPSSNEDEDANSNPASGSTAAGTASRDQEPGSAHGTSGAMPARQSPRSSGRHSSRMGIPPGHLSILKSHYTLMDSVWTPLIMAKPTMNGTSVDTKTGVALLDIYWTWLHPLHHLVYRPAFIMDLALGGPHCSDFLLLCIFALAARHLPSEESSDTLGSTRGEEYANRARKLLLNEMTASTPSIPTIQGLLILGGRQCAIGSSSQGWLYTGMAIRMMQDIGLHLDTTHLAGVAEKWTPTELEVRKRLYNAAYVWDKTLCLALGRPPTLVRRPYLAHELYDKYDDDRPWQPVHAKEVVESFAPCPGWVTSTLCAFSSLHEITTDMLLLFSRAHGTKQLAEQVANIDVRFGRWYAELPEGMKISQPSTLSQSPPPHIVSLNLLYHTLHILLRRPFLGNRKRAVESYIAEHTKLCIKHSKEIHEIHTLYTKTFPHRLMTYQVSYCIYTAATVEALELKGSSLSPEERSGAAARLTAAVRILQNEASHTPGSGKSLDTIRRLLTEGDRPNARCQHHSSRRKRRSSARDRPRKNLLTRDLADPSECSPSAVTEASVPEGSGTPWPQAANDRTEPGPPTTNTEGSSEFSIQTPSNADAPALTNLNNTEHQHLRPPGAISVGNVNREHTAGQDPGHAFDSNAGMWGLDLGFYGGTDTGAGFHPDAFSFMFGANAELPPMPTPATQMPPPNTYLYSPDSLWSSSRHSWPAQGP